MANISQAIECQIRVIICIRDIICIIIISFLFIMTTFKFVKDEQYLAVTHPEVTNQLNFQVIVTTGDTPNEAKFSEYVTYKKDKTGVNRVLWVKSENLDPVRSKILGYKKIGTVSAPVDATLTKSLLDIVSKESAVVPNKSEFVTEASIKPRIALTAADARIFVQKEIATNARFQCYAAGYKKQRLVGIEDKCDVVSFCLNAMLCLMGADFYQEIRPAVQKLILDGVLDPYSVTALDNRKASECKVELSAFMLVVLMSWLGINKAVSSSKSQNVIDWIAQRDKPLLLKMGATSLDPEVRRCLHANVAVDMLVIGTYLNDKRTLRKILYEQLLTKDTELTDYGRNIKELAGGILKFTGMSTVKIAYQFAKACETMAHTNRDVVNQSIKLEKYWESKCNEPHIGTTIIYFTALTLSCLLSIIHI